MSNPLAWTVMELKNSKTDWYSPLMLRQGMESGAKGGRGPAGGHVKHNWRVPDFSGSGDQNAANVRFCIPFNKLFCRTGNTREVHVGEKGQRQEREWKESKREAAVHVIDLFFSIWEPKKRKGTWKTGKPLVDFIARETSIHSSSTRYMTFRAH